MPRALCLTVAILGFLGGPAAAAAPTDLGANAALKYWQAFATLPRFTGEEQKKLNAECTTMPLDAGARAMVSRADYSFKMLHAGAALPRCDWAIGFDEGIAQLLPQNDGALVLTALSCLRARIRFEEAHDAEAVADLLEALTLARHVSVDGYLVSVLIGYRIEERTGRVLAAHLPELPPGMLKDLKARLGALPPGGSEAAAMRDEEKASLDWLIRQVKDVDRKIKNGEDKDKALASLHEDLKRLIEECGGTTAGFFKFAKEMRPWYADMAAKWDLPLDRFEKEWEREKAVYAGNPVFKTYVPAVVKVRQAQARADVRRALLAAAIDLELAGREGLTAALKNHPDPVVGGPFDYEEFPGGFEVRSKWRLGSRPLYHSDTPLALTVGRRQK